MKEYQPVPPQVRERLEIAVLVEERMELQWAEEDSDRAFIAKVIPQEVVNVEGRVYLLATDETGKSVRIRIDLIRNLPTPMK